MRASERAAIVAAVATAFEAIFLFRARPELGGRPDWPLREVVASERRGMGEVKTTEKRGESGGVEVERRGRREREMIFFASLSNRMPPH